MTIRIGAHVDQMDPVGSAVSLGANLCQFFLGDPQSWSKPKVEFDGGAVALREAAEAADVALYVHAPYLINVASTNNRIRIPSRKLLQQTLDLAGEIGAAGVIVHGGHVTKDDAPEKGYENWFKCIDGLTMSAPLLIENTAGGNNAMARYLESIEKVWEAVSAASGGDTVGFCLDTCHAHAAGLGLAGLVDRVKAITGRIDLMHLNDSRDAAGSGADRHANLGQGQCDPEELLAVVREAGANVCLETPRDMVEGDLQWLKKEILNA